MPGAKSFIEVGFNFLKENRVRDAKVHFEEALNILPSSGEAASGLAIVLAIHGNIIKAYQLLERALKIEPNNKIIIDAAKYVLKLSNIEYETETIQETISEYLILQKETVDFFDTRTGLINYCISIFQFKMYLEIGCHDNYNFNQINCSYKIGVDPIQGGTLCLTSDEFFSLTKDTFDIIFIDGLHHCEQSLKDVKNSFQILNPGGLVFLHDCLPKEEIHQLREPKDYIWNGDVWKAFIEIRQEENLDSIVSTFDHGVGIIRKSKNLDPIVLKKDYQSLTFEDYKKNFDIWLKPKDCSQILEWL